jgi:hypothetical protein
MPFITNKAVVIIDGVEYPNNDLSVNDDGDLLTIALDRALDPSKFYRVHPYNGVLDKENGVLEYDCTATQTNGHIMKFKLRFPSANVCIRRRG